MQFIQKFVSKSWRSIGLYGGLFAGFGLLLYWRLSTLLPGYSQYEVATHNAGLNITGLLDNPLNAPFLAAIKVLSWLQVESPLAARLVAVGGGLLVLALFCIMLRTWHNTRTAILGTLLFGTSAWFLHVARMGTPEIMMFGVFALFAAGYWFKQKQSWPALFACMVIGTAFLYVPGMVWFMIIGLVWQWRTIDAVFKKHLMTLSLGTLLILIALLPLVLALYRDTSLIMPWLGLPSDWPMPLDILKNILLVPYHLVVSGESRPEMWLGTAAVLDVFSVAGFVVGSWLYLKRFRLLRTPIIISILAAGVVLIGLGQGTLTLILPFIYLIIAAGVGHLLGEWLDVFPRNPIARGIGMGLLGVVLVLVLGYHLRHYFVGFPEARATHDVYTTRYQ